MPQQDTFSSPHALARATQGPLVRAYFRLKPFIPRSLRWVMRRVRIPGILRRNAGIWPIDESACQKPVDWPGWPDGKEFALVFTHDVESEEGLGGVRQLAELEMSFGFRSSFNFIPEGSYKDPKDLRSWLEDRGFEVGVHDLNHDGHLYESRASFSEKAKSINGYLGKWGAVGFRSGFMLRQLDWLHDLNVLYDTSTFDTDPFEPQPQGSQTIFPFHVKPPSDLPGPGYVELSYTLPQDSTLFLLLREKTPEIWKRKLDWIAKHGGLALVNIHPDYIDFSDRGDSTHYPSALLKEFLEYIHHTYDGRYWNPLARELALWYRNVQAHPGADSPAIHP
jgi:hypothetical protein